MTEIIDIPEPPPAPQPQRNIKEALEAASKGAVILVGLCYALGLVVYNLHLGRYGYYSLGLLQLNYIFAGFWALVPVMVGVVAAGVANFAVDSVRRGGQETGKGGGKNVEGGQDQAEAKTGWRSVDTEQILSSAALFIFILMLMSAAAKYIGLEVNLRWAGACLFGVIAGVMFLPLIAPFLFPGFKAPAGFYLFFSAFFVCGLVAYLSYFARYVYHEIPAGLGGGKPTLVRLVVEKEAKPQFDVSGVAVSEPDYKSGPVELLLNSSEGYVVKSKTAEGKEITVIFPHAPVKAVLFERQ